MTKNANYPDYPDIKRYAELEGISIDILIKAFKVECEYHNLLLNETNRQKRMDLYAEFYGKVIPIYGRDGANIPKVNPKDKYASLFQKELEGKNIVDFGCGQGYMLQSIVENFFYKRLVGIDVLIPEELKNHPKILFKEENIIFNHYSEKFDVAISDNVVEHLVPDDAKVHLSTIFKSLNPNGKLILLMPNRLFGPADVTRIKDFSHSGNLDAQGGHVNESTYTEMVANLKAVGFNQFQTVLPIPKFKYTLFKNIRVGVKWIQFIENSPFLLRLFRTLKIKGVCPIRFTVTIIATR